MEVLLIILLMVLEVALLLAGFAVFQFLTIRKLRAELLAMQQALAAGQADDEGFESITSGFLPYLEKQLIENREMQEITAEAAHPDEVLQLALQRRGLFLEAEKHVAELGNDFPKRHWEHVSECYTPEEEPEAETEEEGEVSEEAAAVEQPESVVQMQGALQQQGIAIDSMREIFEKIKEDPNEEALALMEKQLGELERRYQEANTCIEMMEQENVRLQQQMEGVEEEKRKNSEALVTQIGKQKQNVTELCEMLDDLELEAEKAELLQKKLDQFELTSRDMNLCIQVLEEENETLHKQVAAMEQQTGAGDQELLAGLEEKITALQEQLEAVQVQKELQQNEMAAIRLQLQERDDVLGEKEQAMAQLKENYASLEKEYLTLYEASQE